MRSAMALFLTIVMTLLLRSTALTGLAAHGIVLDVLAAATVLWGLRQRETWGATFGFAIGLLADLDAAHWMGRHALVLALTGYAVGRLGHTLVRDSGRTQGALLLVATAVHQTWVGAFEIGGGIVGWPYLLQRVALSSLATAAVGTILLGVLRRLGATTLRHAGFESGPAA